MATFGDYEPNGGIGRAAYEVQGLESDDFAMETVYDYDEQTLRLEEIHSRNRALDDLQEKSYTYTNAGDVVTLINHMTGKEYQYGYDWFHRLTSETVKDRNYGEGGFSVLSNEYTGPHAHAVSATSPSMPGGPTTFCEYDANGNLTRKFEKIITTNTDMPKIDVMAIEYDAKNMPVAIEDYKQSTGTEFGYLLTLKLTSYDSAELRSYDFGAMAALLS